MSYEDPLSDSWMNVLLLQVRGTKRSSVNLFLSALIPFVRTLSSRSNPFPRLNIQLYYIGSFSIETGITAQHSQTIARVFLFLSHPLRPRWAQTTHVTKDDLELLVLPVSHK